MLASLAFSPQQEEPQPAQGQEIEVEFEKIETFNDPEGRPVTLLTGDVVLRTGNVSVRADRMLVWAAQGESPHELFAEGNVRYRRGEDEVMAESMYYHLDRKRGLLTGLQVRGRDPKSGAPFIIRAAEAGETEEGVFHARNIQVSTCDYGEPHFDVTMEEGDIRGVQRRANAGEFDLFPYESYRATGRSIVPHLFGLPVFYLPSASFRPGQESYLRRVRVGRTSRWGAYGLTTWGIGITRGAIDPFLPGDQSTGREDEKWGDAFVHLDYRQLRGFATGLGIEYEDDDYRGIIDSYLLFDQGPADDTKFDRRFLETGEQTRGRVRAFHRHRLSDELRGEIEFSWLSDRNVLEEFFPVEFREGKEQETTAYLRWLRGSVGGFAQVRPRVNSFQTQEEFLPRFGFQATAIPLLAGLSGPTYLGFRSELGNFHLAPDHSLNVSDPRTARWDNDVEVAQPISLDFVTLRPFAGARLTAYENDADGDANARFLGRYGIDAEATAARTYDVDSESLGLHGLRHVMVFGLGYTNAPLATTSRSGFDRIDSTDSAWKFSELYLDWEHRFSTRVPTGENEWESLEFLRLGAAAEFYPDPGRDTGFLNENTTLYPYRSLFLGPDVGATFTHRPWSNVHLGLEFSPRSIVRAGVHVEFDPFDGDVPREHTYVTLNPYAGVGLQVSHDYVSGVTDAFGAEATLRLWDKWMVGGRMQYDALSDRFTRTALFLERDLHDFILGFEFDNDLVRDDIRFLFELTPKFLRTQPPEPRERGVGPLPDRR